jgi:ParB family chromosome partitioning protein
MQDSSAFQFLAIDQIHESTTNPRQTFNETKLNELAESIKHNGMIQPITVRPNNKGFEIVAGARRYRAAQIAELFSVPARIVEIDDAEALEWTLTENALREDVHPYEEAQGYQRLLEMPGYDVAALVEKLGKSASHIYARMSLLQLIPTVAQAFTEERITASHANLIARLPQESQATAYEQCWRKDWQDKEAHLLPAKHVAAWIQTNLYLSLADAPFDREDPTLNPTAGACSTCPRRSGHNTTLFCDVQGDQCLDSACYGAKVEVFLNREIAAHPGFIQIENSWRNPKEQRPGAVQRGQVRDIPTVIDNPDAEPAMPCAAARTAIIVYGKQLGRKLSVCTDKHCPVHDPRTAAELASNPIPKMESTKPAETEEEASARQADFEQRQNEYEEERQRNEQQRKELYERQQAEHEAEQTRRAELLKVRQATFERILENAPPMFTAAQLRVLLRALVNLDRYTFIDDVAQHFASDDENHQQTAEDILTTTIDTLAEDKVTSFALRLSLTGHIPKPHESESDFLAEADAAFQPRKQQKERAQKAIPPTPIKRPTVPKKANAKRKAA